MAGDLLSYGEFQKLPGYKGASRGKYQRYRSYVTRRRSEISTKRAQAQGVAGAAGAFGGYAPMNDAQILAEARRLFPVMTPQQLRAQASRSVSASINPLIANLTKTITGREKSALSAIGAATGAHEARLQPFAGEVRDVYSRAGAEQEAIDKGLRDMIGASGQQLAAQQPDLAAAGLGTGLAGAIAQGTQGQQAAAAGVGAATRSRLASEGASTEAYARLLPGFANLEGQAAENAARREYGQMLSEGIGEYRAQVPGMVETQFSNLQNLDQARRSAMSTLIESGRSRSAQVALARAALAQDYASLAQQGSQFEQGLLTPKPGTAGADTGETPAEFRKRLSAAALNAAGTAHDLRTVPTDQLGNPIPGKTYVDVVNAYKRIVAYFRQNFPGQNQAWWTRQAIDALETGGYVHAGEIIPKWLKGKPYQPGAGTGKAAGGSKGGGGGGKPYKAGPSKRVNKPPKSGPGYIPRNPFRP